LVEAEKYLKIFLCLHGIRASVTIEVKIKTIAIWKWLQLLYGFFISESF